jgi:hypothetical protein
MATMKIEIVAGGTTYTRSKTISAGDLTRMFTAERALLGLPANASDQVAFDTWSEEIYRIEKGRIKSVEQGTAVKTAADGVADIALT